MGKVRSGASHQSPYSSPGTSPFLASLEGGPRMLTSSSHLQAGPHLYSRDSESWGPHRSLIQGLSAPQSLGARGCQSPWGRGGEEMGREKTEGPKEGRDPQPPGPDVAPSAAGRARRGGGQGGGQGSAPSAGRRVAGGGRSPPVLPCPTVPSSPACCQPSRWLSSCRTCGEQVSGRVSLPWALPSSLSRGVRRLQPRGG